MLMSVLAGQLIKKIDEIKEPDFKYLGLFEELENKLSLEKLRKKLESLKDSHEEVDVTPNHLLMQRLAKRWEIIDGGEASYMDPAGSQDSRHKSPANGVYADMAKQLEVAANQKKHSKYNDAAKFAKPVSHLIDVKNHHLSLKQKLLPKLRKKKSQVVEILDAANFNMSMLAKKVLYELDRMPKDNPADFNLLIYGESQIAVAKLRKLLATYVDSNEPINDTNLMELNNFLRARWDVIDRSRANYDTSRYTQANMICPVLAYYLSVAGFKCNSLNDDPDKILKHQDHVGRTAIDAEKNLKEYVAREFNGNEELEKQIKFTREGSRYTYDLSKLKDYVKGKDELQCRAILLSLYQMYINHATPNVTVGNRIGSFFSGIYAGDKVDAAEAAQAYIIEHPSLVDFNAELNKSGTLLNKHFAALTQPKSELAKFYDITSFIAKEASRHAIETRREKVVEKSNTPMY